MIDSIQKERGARYGEFAGQARISQNIKNAMKDSPNWNDLEPYMKEALEMTAHKMARVLNGDMYYDDSWIDKSSYLDLVVKEIRKRNNKEECKMRIDELTIGGQNGNNTK